MTESPREAGDPASSDRDEFEQTRPLSPPAQPEMDTLSTRPVPADAAKSPPSSASAPPTPSGTRPTFGAGLNPENASQAWDIVSERVEALVAAWDQAKDPPDLAGFLPDGPSGLRRLALVELIKVDLMYRWQRKGQPQRRLEQYLSEFPELSASGDVPYDLIYEEYYVRRQLGESVEPREYFERFPRQAEELKRLLRIESDAHLTTALVSGERFKNIEVGDKLDDFDLLTRVGKGAFATVFLARQRSMQRLVALKISADRGNEPQTMAQLDHPHIVRVYDQRVLLERKLRLLYMQYIPGGTLQGVVELVRKTPAAARAGPMLMAAVDQSLEERGDSPPGDSRLRQRLAAASWPEVVCWLGARLAGALEYAHQRGVLHRDLKPANVLVAADGSPKLADFNISFCSHVEGATPAAYFGGSLSYMSPEQLEAFNPANARTADEMDGRSDIYALGILLWELLVGRRPFQDAPVDGEWSKTLDTMVARRRAGVLPSMLAELPKNCPPGLDQILLGCLAPEAADRFASAGQLARQLEMCLQPRVQRLLRPRTGDWRQKACRYSLLALLVAGLLPNVIASGMNIAYNYFELVEPLNAPADSTGDSSAATDIFWVQVWVVNPIAYLIGVGVLVPLAWPVLQSVRGLMLGKWNDPERLPLLRHRCLRIGDYVAWVTAVEWTVSGIVFPLWIRLEGGADLEMKSIYYVHFLTSQVLCGLIAASQSFFCITFLSVRVFYPPLVRQEGDDTSGLERLRALAQRTNAWFFLAVSVPFLAIFAVILLVNEREDRYAIASLGAVGLLAFAIAYRLSQSIHYDVDALGIAASPGQDALAASETADSFWVSSR